jgi:tetratricopeptide (TPR) repeat protein
VNCPICRTTWPGEVTGPICPRCALARALHDPAPGIAGYELLHEIGRGGMGIVWLARERTLDRLVALKVIAPGADPALAERLLREGQAAARLRHPHIVSIHALGGSGPATYLAMAFLEGGNLAERLDGRGRPYREAAALAAKLADALTHAHGAGILHRDIKPSNVLLDRAGEPQLADFGLATPYEGRGDLTEPGQLAGTRAYLAPELLERADRASPRSDVYGLGAVLYATLTGRPPFVADAEAALLRRIAEDPPPSPRLWHPEIPRDLETICLHCLEKSPERRYASAAALRDDLQRFLRGEAIAARPITWAGRTVRWARRKPAAAAALGLAAALLLLLALGGPLVAYRLDRSRRAAANAAATAAALSDFFQNDLLAQASPDHQPDRDLKLRTVLDRASAQIGDRFGGRPAVEASIRQTLGETYLALGEYASAERHLQRALELRRQTTGPESAETLKLEFLLASTWIGLGRYADAGAAAERTLAAQQRLLGPEHPDTLLTDNLLGTTLWRQGNYKAAEARVAALLPVCRRVTGPESPTTLRVLGNLAAVYAEESKYAQAEALYKEGIAAYRRTLGPENPQTLVLMSDLAVVYNRWDRLADAEPLACEALALRRKTLGPEHPATLQSMNNLAGVYRYEGRYAEAQALMTQVFEVQRRLLGPEHPETLIALVNLGILLRDAGRFPEAERTLTQALELWRRTVGPDHPYTVTTEGALAFVDKAEGRLAEAAALSRKVLAARQRILGPTHAETLWIQSELGDILLLDHHPEEAAAVLQSALERSAAGKIEPWRAALTRSRLGEALAETGHAAAAEPLLVQGYADLRADEARIPAFVRFEVAKAAERLRRLTGADLAARLNPGPTSH